MVRAACSVVLNAAVVSSDPSWALTVAAAPMAPDSRRSMLPSETKLSPSLNADRLMNRP